MLHFILKKNFADILTKHWGWQGTYHELIQSVFHHEGNTVSLFLDDILEVDASFEDGSKMIFGILGSDRIFC